MATDTKRRILFTANAQFAAVPADNGRPAQLTGYALVWNALSTDRGGYKVRLRPGSAKFATPTQALFEHDFRQVLGDSENQTLVITPDDVGVKVTMMLPDATYARDAFNLVRDRYIRGMSFAMVEAPWGIAGWTAAGPQIIPVQGSATVAQENGETVVTVSGGFVVDEVTITGRPSFPETTIGVGPDAPGPMSYSDRNRQLAQLNAFQFDLLRHSGSDLPRVA